MHPAVRYRGMIQITTPPPGSALYTVTYTVYILLVAMFPVFPTRCRLSSAVLHSVMDPGVVEHCGDIDPQKVKAIDPSVLVVRWVTDTPKFKDRLAANLNLWNS